MFLQPLCISIVLDNESVFQEEKLFSKREILYIVNTKYFILQKSKQQIFVYIIYSTQCDPQSY